MNRKSRLLIVNNQTGVERIVDVRIFLITGLGPAAVAIQSRCDRDSTSASSHPTKCDRHGYPRVDRDTLIYPFNLRGDQGS